MAKKNNTEIEKKNQKLYGYFLIFQSFMGDQDAPRGKAAYLL